MSAHVADRLGPYLDAELPADDRAEVTAHLQECAACRRLLEEMAVVDGAARSLSVEEPAGYFDTFASRLRPRLRAKAKARFALPVWSLAAAAALVLAVITPIALRERGTAAPGSPPLPAPVAEPPARVGTPEAPPTSATGDEEPRLKAEAKPALDDAKKKAATSRDEVPGGYAPKDALGGDAEGRVRTAEAASTPAQQPKEEAEDRRDAPEPSAPPAAFAGAPAEGREADALQRQAPARSQGATAQVASSPRLLGKTAAADRGAMANVVPATTAAELRYRSLVAQPASTAAEARSLREAWRAFVVSEPAGLHSDEARVRGIEAGAAAFRLSAEKDDRATLERDAANYLARPDAPQAGRVRALMASINPN